MFVAGPNNKTSKTLSSAQNVMGIPSPHFMHLEVRSDRRDQAPRASQVCGGMGSATDSSNIGSCN